jgi:transcriptional regulator
MYIPPHNRNDDLQQLHAFVKANSFATLVSQHDGTPLATHLPLQVIAEGERWRIEGHVARANPQWQSLEGQTVLAIFNGPHAYISPTNYAQNTGVPTWNYAVVHVYGRISLLHDEAGKMRVLTRLQHHYEHTAHDTFMAQPEAFRSGQLRGIVAFDMQVERIEGKYKLSQNRSRDDRESVTVWLEGSAHAAPRGTAVMMRAALEAEQEKAR